MITQYLRSVAIAAIAVLGVVHSASAVPIVYEGQVDSTMKFGTVVGGNNTGIPSGWDYWLLSADAGSLVTIDVRRTEFGLDPASGAFIGVFADTSSFTGIFDGIASGDDDVGDTFDGPFGDPSYSFLAPSTGFYTIAVTSFLSSGGGPFGYSIVASGANAAEAAPAPAPGALALVGLGLLAFGAVRRRRA